MAKSARKLSLKKETLRQLDDRELGAVAGGTLVYYNAEAVMLKQPSKTFSGGCTGDGLFFNYYFYW